MLCCSSVSDVGLVVVAFEAIYIYGWCRNTSVLLFRGVVWCGVVWCGIKRSHTLNCWTVLSGKTSFCVVIEAGEVYGTLIWAHFGVTPCLRHCLVKCMLAQHFWTLVLKFLYRWIRLAWLATNLNGSITMCSQPTLYNITLRSEHTVVLPFKSVLLHNHPV